MAFETAGAGVPAATEDDGVLVVEISGLPPGFCPQPATTMAVSIQVKDSRKLLKYFTLTCPHRIQRQLASNPGQIRNMLFAPQTTFRRGEHIKVGSEI
jgi:hypothetical protein